MKESNVWEYVNGNRPLWLAIERFEPMYPPGMPDCFWSDTRQETGGVFAVSGWLELKYCQETDKEYQAGRIPKLRPEQPLFLNRQARNRVPSGILLRVGTRHWLLWVASGDPMWANFIRSNEAIRNPASMWLGSAFSVEDMIEELMRLHNLA